MSIHVLNWVWKNSQSTHAARLVLLALADCADDGGGAYPGISALCKKTLLSERGVQAAIRDLVHLGELRVMPNAGPMSCNYYIINITPAESAPLPQTLHPAESAPPQSLRLPPANFAPKPSGEPSTINPHSPPTPPDPSAAPPQAAGQGDEEARAEAEARAKAEAEAVKAAAKAKADAAERAAKLALMQRFNRIVHRRDSTKWLDKEKNLLRKLYPIPEEDLADVEAYYAVPKHEFPMGRDGRREDYRRRRLDTLLANWPGEVDAARQFLAQYRKRKPSAKADNPAIAPVPIIGEPTEEEKEQAHEARYRAKVRAGLVRAISRERADDPTLAIPPRMAAAAA